MCVKPALNPNAEEWRPTPPQPPHLPHLILHSQTQLSAAPPPPPQALQVVAFAPTPQKLPNPYSYPRQSCQGFLLPHDLYTRYHSQPYYCVSASADPNGDEAEGSSYGNELTQQENKKRDEKKMLASPIKSPRRCNVNVYLKGNGRCLPPRLQRKLRNFFPEKQHQSPPSKQVWKPTKSPKPDDGVSSNGDGSLSPAPISPLPAAFSSDFSPLSSNTTVMIKNIPNELRRDFMLKFLDGLCHVHSLEYDFLYLPMDFRTKNNLGYAFLNLTSPLDAQKFKKILENYKWGVVHTDGGPITSKKVCDITMARIQGKAALVRRFKNANFTCDELDFLPVVLDPPRNGSDPNPPPPEVIGRICGRSN